MTAPVLVDDELIRLVDRLTDRTVDGYGVVRGLELGLIAEVIVDISQSEDEDPVCHVHLVLRRPPAETTTDKVSP
jgi:hypothetical protein